MNIDYGTKNLTERQNKVLEDGYYIEKNIFDAEDMEEIFINFYDICFYIALKYNIKHEAKSPNDISYRHNLKDLDNLVLTIFNANKDFLGEIYDTFSYSLAFMRFLGNKKVEIITKELLNLHKTSSLYGWTNRMRIDPPSDERRTYGWHQEVFYTIPDTKFLQTWCPMLRNTTISNGTIQVKKGSHKEGVAKQSWNEIDGRATQIIVDPEITDRYETISLEMKVGDLLFFDGRLIHKSGKNITKDEVRFSLVGMWNDPSYNGFRAPKPNFTSRTISAKEYFRQLMD